MLWFDAHGDLNTPTDSVSGYLGGMCLSAVLGEWDSGHGAGLAPQDTLLLAVRDLDPAEDARIAKRRISTLPSPDTDEALARVLEFVRGRAYYVHLDLDCFDPTVVSAEYQVAGGLTGHAIRRVLQAASTGRLLGAEITEFEPRNEGDLPIAADLVSSCVTALFDHQAKPTTSRDGSGRRS